MIYLITFYLSNFKYCYHRLFQDANVITYNRKVKVISPLVKVSLNITSFTPADV